MEGDTGTRSRAGLRRREFLIGGAGAGLVLAGPVNYAAIARGLRAPVAKHGKFAHGVAAGFPSPKGITLWTRVSELERTSKLTLEVAKDKHFNRLVKSKEVLAEGGRDFTVHEHVGGLDPGHEYFYRFQTKNKSSRAGRFRTLPPPDSKQKIRIGFYSCQDWEAGYFNAQAGLAAADVDLVICLGDYIYEHRYYPGPSDRLDTLGANGDGDVQSLAEYRSKYRLYQTDEGLQAMHAAHAFVGVWDDHEVEDNYAGDQPDSAATDPNLENNNEYPRRVPFGERRKNGYKAFFEAMPRLQMKGAKNQIYGSMRIGGLAELFLTDQRQYRDPQPCADALLEPCPSSEDPGRTYLGAEQKKWFKKAVVKSDAKWKLWGSETMVMSLDLPKTQHVSQDQWDGYSAERREILEHFLSKGVTNLTALTGDIHTFLAGDMTTTGNIDGTPVGVELVGGSATSLGIPEFLGVPSPTLQTLREANDPHVKYADFDRRGYGVVTVSKSKLTGEFFAVDALTRGAQPSLLASFEVPSGARTLNRVA